MAPPLLPQEARLVQEAFAESLIEQRAAELTVGAPEVRVVHDRARRPPDRRRRGRGPWPARSCTASVTRVARTRWSMPKVRACSGVMTRAELAAEALELRRCRQCASGRPRSRSCRPAPRRSGASSRKMSPMPQIAKLRIKNPKRTVAMIFPTRLCPARRIPRSIVKSVP